jgi:hypothetical protein
MYKLKSPFIENKPTWHIIPYTVRYGIFTPMATAGQLLQKCSYISTGTRWLSLNHIGC